MMTVTKEYMLREQLSKNKILIAERKVLIEIAKIAEFWIDDPGTVQLINELKASLPYKWTRWSNG